MAAAVGGAAIIINGERDRQHQAHENRLNRDMDVWKTQFQHYETYGIKAGEFPPKPPKTF